MKNRLLILLSFFTLILVSCKKDEHRIYYEGGTAPALTASVTSSIPLSFTNKDQEAIKLSWTNPNYQFTTGVSSQDVNYIIEIDTTGSNFSNPQKKTLAISNDLSRTFTQNEFNDFLLNQLALKAGQAHSVEIRVKSALGNNSATLISNVLKYTVTPYAIPPKVAPPANGTLWMTGDAAPSGWQNPLPAPYDVNQKFTKVSDTFYELVVDLPGGGGYKLIQEQGDWSKQYHMLAGGTAESGDFEKKDSDPQFPGPAAAGKYKIQVDFQRGKYTVTKL